MAQLSSVILISAIFIGDEGVEKFVATPELRANNQIGDRDPRAHEFTLQLRAFDAAKKGSRLGVAALIAMCSSVLKKSVKGGLIVIGEIPCVST